MKIIVYITRILILRLELRDDFQRKHLKTRIGLRDFHSNFQLIFNIRLPNKICEYNMIAIIL